MPRGDNLRNRPTKHLARHPLYRTWVAMRSRCYDKSHRLYNRYGGRGITVCLWWHNFENFLADMGERPPDHQLHRWDNNGNYQPSNCSWISSTRHHNIHSTRGDVE